MSKGSHHALDYRDVAKLLGETGQAYVKRLQDWDIKVYWVDTPFGRVGLVDPGDVRRAIKRPAGYKKLIHLLGPMSSIGKERARKIKYITEEVNPKFVESAIKRELEILASRGELDR